MGFFLRASGERGQIRAVAATATQACIQLDIKIPLLAATLAGLCLLPRCWPLLAATLAGLVTVLAAAAMAQSNCVGPAAFSRRSPPRDLPLQLAADVLQ
jgi:hypothetical protein